MVVVVGMKTRTAQLPTSLQILKSHDLRMFDPGSSFLGLFSCGTLAFV